MAKGLFISNNYGSAVYGAFTQNFILFLLIHSIIININYHYVAGDADWMQECGVCHCKWISSKKIADCKKTSLVGVPKELSSELQVIDLSFNSIPELQRNEFKEANLPNLHKIFMKNCTLQEIHRDTFKGLSLLIELDLSNNLLKVLEPGIFFDVIRLRVLTLVHNQIERLGDYLFENLIFLAKVDVRYNMLNYVGQHTFVNVSELKEIDLDNNRLTVLREDTFRNLDKLRSLTLFENPWNCTCDLQQFQKYVTSKGLYTQPTSCQEPAELRGKLWTDIPSENFACRPRIILPRDGSTIDATNENITLACRIKGSPKPEVSWTYNGHSLDVNDPRIHIRNSQEVNRRESLDTYISELIIIGVKNGDRGSYTCTAQNTGGKSKAEIFLTVPPVSEVIAGVGVMGTPSSTASTNDNNDLLLIICLIAIILLALLIIVVLILCCYCRRVKKYAKNGSISENGLMPSKIDRSQDSSILEGSVIMEMQKSLLTEVNPVEKPPRRTELDGSSDFVDDGHELKRTLLDESSVGHLDEETHSIALSDTTPRSRATFVDDGYGTNLPPDLLSFPSRFAQSPSTQSSISNIPDGHLYIKSPVSSPIYQHNPYMAGPQAGFRTLQHPKNRNLAIINRNNSPFQPAPVIYAPVVMKQGYVTIPRKPRTPSWAPSIASTIVDFPPTSPPSAMSPELAIEPVYDNLGLRTTASGHSVLSLNKLGSIPANSAASKYSMKDRPLPATPLLYDPIQEQSLLTAADLTNGNSITDDTEVLFKKSKEPQAVIVSSHINNNNNSSSSNNNNSSSTRTSEKATATSPTATAKVPPRPPPKPKKRSATTISAIAESDGTTTSQLYEDECEDGTEV